MPYDERQYREIVQKQAKEQTMETLPAFLESLSHVGTKDGETVSGHGYDTIVIALGAAAIGAATALNKHERTGGGIRGFQAGAVMWEMMMGWGTISKDDHPKLVMQGQLLFPQHDNRWEKTINRGTFDALVKLATENLATADAFVAPPVLERWTMIAEGRLPDGFTVRED